MAESAVAEEKDVQKHMRSPLAFGIVYELIATTNIPSELRNLSYNQLTSKDIADAANNGDKLALAAFDFTAKILGLKLADLVAYLSPDAVILFGGLALPEI